MRFEYSTLEPSILRHAKLYIKESKTIIIEVFGIVQGVGFRPYIYNLATSFNLKGFVRNDSLSVKIMLEASPLITNFLESLIQNKVGRIESLSISYTTLENDYNDFVIEDSTISPGSALGVSLPLDYKICDRCIEDLDNKHSRFYNYAFVSCVDCGSRYSILDSLPYHRDNTSMAHLALCDECRGEYLLPSNRRFHAEQISCNNCAINYSAITLPSGKIEDRALLCIAQRLREGQVVLWKGLGGFAYIADAKNSKALNVLRKIKRRPHKPFVVMADIERLKDIALLDERLLSLLDSKESPIILARKSSHYDLSHEVSAMDTIGVMIPYTAMLVMLFRMLGSNFALCYTSANRKGDMIATSISELDMDFILQHQDSITILDYDREILHKLDDSIISGLFIENDFRIKGLNFLET